MILEIIHQKLTKLDQKIPKLSPKEIQKEFELIPLDIFGRIQIDRPKEYPNLMRWFAEMPASEVQLNWTGSHDHTLMTQSLSFMKTIVSSYHEITRKPLAQSSVLDFGCGWGRMLRLFTKYVPTDQLYGVDPWDQSIEICRKTNVKAHLLLSDYLPRTLPTPENQKFDFIFAFSVFTHLSENATKICASTLRNYLSDDGVIAITIRPEEYWNFRLKHIPGSVSNSEARALIESHKAKGIAFAPHNREKIEGEITYGDTSMTLDYITDNFEGLEIDRVELNEIDLFQVIVFLRKAAGSEVPFKTGTNKNDAIIP